MRIVADENMPLVRELFSPYGEVVLRNGRQIGAADVLDADALLVRSVTKVDHALIENSRLRFVGSATIGTDHIDLDALRAARIVFANAPGCNAQAVAEYVLSALLVLHEQGRFDPVNQRIGIVGYGNVGRRLARLLEHLQWSYVLNDPPLLNSAQAEHLTPSLREKFVDKAALLKCDVITLHVPMIKSGEYVTRHWLGVEEFVQAPFKTVINACRGAVVDNQALLRWLNQDKSHAAVLDVWENEPLISDDLLARVDLATPHIAGYSLEGKTNGSFMVLDAFCKKFGFIAPHARRWRPAKPQIPEISASDAMSALKQKVWAVYDIRKDDARMRTTLASAIDRARAFDELRKNYPERRELGEKLIEY